MRKIKSPFLNCLALLHDDMDAQQRRGDTLQTPYEAPVPRAGIGLNLAMHSNKMCAFWQQMAALLCVIYGRLCFLRMI